MDLYKNIKKAAILRYLQMKNILINKIIVSTNSYREIKLKF
jgi:hypothetical protein